MTAVMEKPKTKQAGNRKREDAIRPVCVRPSVVEVNSLEFAERLTATFAAATKAATETHRKAGRPVPGVVDGKLVQIAPDGRISDLKRRS